VEYHFELSPLVLAKFDPSSSICDELEVELLDDANVEDNDPELKFSCGIIELYPKKKGIQKSNQRRPCVECPDCCLCSEPVEGEERAFDIVWVRERHCTIMYTIVTSLASDAN
jgi:hypothetical protein